ncbi:MAG TPA: NAD(P)H-hydrate dehydratase [candidate division WOR-3 bacterium]|uniref:Bifunctional NAD(P)H-hydrate repair enzyme n=1 Tax=candidate division WOR-3 bacterium TaxID=2052148 RepID=A0A9C9JZ48_UNCW3|nr:NAD(P)H-hydrate dehydratase [candidate division WOR-3 bacterium]
MRIVTNSEMKKIDEWAIKKLKIPGIVLMENAGQGCVNVLEEYYSLENLNVLIICGKGNNGGDGFVIARHLQNRGASPEIILTGKGTLLKGDALVNYRLAKRAGMKIHETTEIKKIKRIINSLQPMVIIDALFGTGFKGAPKKFYAELFDIINNSNVFVFSVDIPSGVNGDDGQFEKTCVVADVTATMCLPKRGNYLYPGRELGGDLYIVDIGIPYRLIDEGFPRIIEFEEISQLMPFRAPEGNKGTFGNILIIAGARGFSGAAAMAAVSAIKSGAGLVRLAAPIGIMDALESKLLEIVKVPLEQTDKETISPAALQTLIPHLEKSDVVVVGPGITCHPETAEFVFKLLPALKKPLIIDADALNILAQDITFFKKLRAPFIITPHPGELSRLINLPPREINLRRIDLAPELAKKFNGILILKGAPTVIASPDGKIYVNPTGNSGLASAGSGDVLVGMISGFIGQGATPFDASLLGVFLHGLCADLAMENNNEYSLTAGDLIGHIPRAFNYILQKEFVEDKDND